MWEGAVMKIAIKAMIAGAAVCAFAAPASAYTINGTIPGKTKNMIANHLQKPPSAKGNLKLTFSSPPVNAGVPYVVGFCLAAASAPASNPCGSEVGLYVLPGQQLIVFVASNFYPNYVVWVGQGTNAAVPYTLDVDYIP
jgi:hypothetical protein